MIEGRGNVVGRMPIRSECRCGNCVNRDRGGIREYLQEVWGAQDDIEDHRQFLRNKISRAKRGVR